MDAANGDLLDAIIEPEKQGKIKAPSKGGYYSSEKTIDASVVAYKENFWEKQTKNCHREKSFLPREYYTSN